MVVRERAVHHNPTMYIYRVISSLPFIFHNRCLSGPYRWTYKSDWY